MFRVGMVDESFTHHGRLHLLEHLSLHGRGGGTLQVNGSISLLTTTFDAHGPADRVADHLTAVARWLASPDLTMLEHELRVLRAESRGRAGGGSAEALTWRYGAGGPGLAAIEEYGLAVRDPDELVMLAAEVFTRSNAAIALDGPPPAGLEIPLPIGSGLRQIPVAQPCETTLPGSYMSAGLAISGTTERSVAATLLPHVLEKGLRDRLRHRDASSYAPWSHYEAVDRDTALVVAGADITPDAVEGVASAAAALINQLADEGPVTTDLDDVIAQVAQGMRDPYSAAGFAWRSAHRWLQGHEPESMDEAVAAVEKVTPDAIRLEADRLRGTAMIGAPEGASTPPGYRRIQRPDGTRLDGRNFRSRNWPADPSVLSISPDEVQIRNGAAVHDVRFGDLVGLVKFRDGTRTLVAADGWNLTIVPQVWARGSDAVHLVDSGVHPKLHVEALTDEVAAAYKRLGWVRRWMHGLRRSLGTERASVIAVAIATVCGFAALLTGVWPGVVVAGMFIYQVRRDRKRPAADETVPT